MIKTKGLDIKVKGVEKALNDRLVKKMHERIETFIEILFKNHPVKTGQSLVSWNMSVDNPNDKFIIKAPNTKDPWLSRDAASAVAKANIKTRMKIIKPGSDVRIFNNHEYVKYFEYGTTKQAAQGVIRASLEKAKNVQGK